jgi:hypothetical protein
MIEYKTTWGEILRIPNNEHNKWVIEMLQFIAEREWWEESQDKYFKLYYKWIYESKRKEM